MTATNVPSIYEFQVFDDLPVTTVAVAPIHINEWMANNTHTLADPAGGYAPWFELYNAGTTNVNLAGYSLTGSPTNLLQFQIPAGYTIVPGGFLLVWTDGQTGWNAGADLHVNFSLAQSSLIALWNAAGQLVDTVDLFPQTADTSSGSLPNGDAAILNLVAATPRQSNNQILGLAAVASRGGWRDAFEFCRPAVRLATAAGGDESGQCGVQPIWRRRLPTASAC